MALFKRRSNESTVLPAEVQEYYKSERRQKTGVAWLLAIVTLLVTFALAAGLFFGGRWIYRSLTDNDQPARPNSQQDDTAQQDGQVTPQSAQTTPTTNNQPPTADQNGSQTLPGNDSTTTDTGITQTPDTAAPNRLVNTGPSDE